VAIALAYMLRTDFGLAMRATGSAEQMIRANGVNTDKMKMIGLGLSNALTALSGCLLVQYQGFADINMGLGVMIVGLGSVIVGEAVGTFFRSGRMWVRLASVVLGTILFRELLAVVLSLGMPTELLKLITSLFVLLVVVAGKAKSRA
jgi:putative ABC transport system permease protein